MDPKSVKSTLQNLAFGNVMAAAGRDYQKEILAQEKGKNSTTANEEVDLDDLMDDPELEKLHADRIAALKREAEKRQTLKRQGHGEYREITEGDFLRVLSMIVEKHLKTLAPKHVDTKFVKLDAENVPFIVVKLAVKTLPCVVLFRTGVATDRLVGFQDLGGKDDFATKTLETFLIRKGIIIESKAGEEDEDEYLENKGRTIRSSAHSDSDTD